MAKKTEDRDAMLALANAKCAALMSALHLIANRQLSGEAFLDEEAIRIWNAAKGINWAENDEELRRAVAAVHRKPT